MAAWSRRRSSASYMGGENDIRGFDIRSVSPVAFLPSSNVITLTNPDGTPVPKNPSNPRQGNWTIPIPVDQIVFPGGDLSAWTNLEYRIYDRRTGGDRPIR